MNPLVIPLLLCLTTCVMANFIHLRKNDKRKLVLGICLAILLFYHIFKDITKLPDINAYVEFFNGLRQLDFNSHGFNIIFILRYEPGWTVLTYLLGLLSGNEIILILVTSIIIVIGYTIFLYRYSPILWLSLIILFAWGYCQSLYVLRQYCALAFCLFAVPYIIKRDFFKFAVFSILGVMFHYSAIVFFPMYWIYEIRINKSFIFKYAIGVVLAAILSKIIFSRLAASEFYYATYLNSDEFEGTSATGLFINLLVISLALFVFRVTKLKGKNKLFFLMSCIALLISVIGIGVPGMVRINLYYTTCFIVFLPICLSKLNIHLRMIGSLMVAACFGLLLFINLNSQSLSSYTLAI